MEECTSFAEETVKWLVSVKSRDSVSHYLHAKWLLHDRRLDPAFEAAKKSYELEKYEATLQLLHQIKQEKENKGKVKKAVPVKKKQG